MEKDTYQKRAADRQMQKDAVSVAPADVEGLSASEIAQRKEELARLNKEQLDDFEDSFDVPTSPKDGTKKSE